MGAGAGRYATTSLKTLMQSLVNRERVIIDSNELETPEASSRVTKLMVKHLRIMTLCLPVIIRVGHTAAGNGTVVKCMNNVNIKTFVIVEL